MGYNTHFDDAISVSPALKLKDIQWLEQFFEDRHESSAGEYPGYWCDLAINEDGDAILWNSDSEKSYGLPEWFAYLIKNYLAERDYVLNGTMTAQGEDADDMWLLHVKDNKVFTEDLIATASGDMHPIGGDDPLVIENTA